jgi:uncharacterized membrane protein YdfJ with MMPL/SSD domain
VRTPRSVLVTLITAAAILLAVAIGAVAASSLKEVGVGVAVAVHIDAFIVRALLVPSLMALFGRRNWRARAWLTGLPPAASLQGGGAQGR